MNTLKKEQYNNWYKLRTYYIAFIVANIPVQVGFCFCPSSFRLLISSVPVLTGENPPTLTSPLSSNLASRVKVVSSSESLVWN